MVLVEFKSPEKTLALKHLELWLVFTTSTIFMINFQILHSFRALCTSSYMNVVLS